MSANNVKNDPMLPVGDKPFWDQKRSKDEEEEPLKSIPESFVLLKSLKQSRDRWLYNTFPKFSTKARGNKIPEITPPPHTFQVRGKCDLEIGPHVFLETTFYEVNYLSSQIPQPNPPPLSNPSSNPYWQSAMAYNSTYKYTAPAIPTYQPITTPTSVTSTTASTSTAASKVVAATSPSESATFGTPLVSSLSPVAPVNGDLISKVNLAASTNPILSNLLQLAAAGNASQDQLKTLGLLIQSLANMPDSASAGLLPSNTPSQALSTQPTNHYQRLPPPITRVPPKPFDIVIEFRENAGERWLFPRGSVYTEMLPNLTSPGLNPDITLTTCLSNDGKMSVSLSEQSSADTSSGSRGLYPVTLRVKVAPPNLKDTISRWIGGEQNNALHKQQINGLVQPKRLYLGLQLPAGSLLTQLQASCGPSYTMKPLRQGPAPIPRQRKPYADSRKAGTISTSSTVSATPAKKSRTSHSKSSMVTPIQCISCKQTDVPLILGGRYCRPCVDSGRWTPLSVPPVNPVAQAMPISTNPTVTTTASTLAPP